MPADVEVQFHARNGQVSLTCGPEAFDRLWGRVAEAAGPVENAPASVQMIVIWRARPAQVPSWRSDRLALFGCGVIGFIFLFVLLVGVQTIAGWVR